MSKKPVKSLHVYLIDDGDRRYYVAQTPGRALTMFLKDTTYPKLTASQYRKECPETTITQCDDNREFTITSLASDTGADEDENKTLTFAQWIKERGEGCLATSDY
jgi:hypothetical protein